jgi:hypothetical protein
VTLEICYADVRCALFVAHDRAVRGEVFNGQCHRGWQCYVRGQCLAMLAMFRDSAKLPGRGFTGTAWGVANGAPDVDRHDGRRVAQLSPYPTLHVKVEGIN